jgi:hypothetical protein
LLMLAISVCAGYHRDRLETSKRTCDRSPRQAPEDGKEA